MTTARLRDLINNNSTDQRDRIIRNILSEQSAHIHFLAEQLFGQILDHIGADDILCRPLRCDTSGDDEVDYALSSDDSDTKAQDVPFQQASVLEKVKIKHREQRIMTSLWSQCLEQEGSDAVSEG